MKKVLAGLLAVSFICLLSSCAGTSPEIELPDVNTVSAGLVERLEFDDVMEKTEHSDIVVAKYGLDDGVVHEVSRYVGSGATADEVAVFECVDEKSTVAVKEAINDRIKYLHDGYSDYGPEEVPKIDNAVVLTYGTKVVFCICKNSAEVSSVVEELALNNN